MNIIQLQDRLKGLPEQALVKYVEQPMGEVPIYLALGELQRRKEMKERFQATQADKPSVAEQLVAEAKPMQMGLGAMAPQQMMPEGQGVGAPQPTPEIDPRQMAASGIAANPQSAVGGTAMMKEGGIVGYAPGGNVQYSDEFIRLLEEQARLNQGTGGPYGGSIMPEYYVPPPKTIIDAQGNEVPFAGSSQRIPIAGKPGEYRTAPFNTSQYTGMGTRASTAKSGEYVPFGEGTFVGDQSDLDSPNRTGFLGIDRKNRLAREQIEREESLYGNAFMSEEERKAKNLPTLESQTKIINSAQQDKNQSISSGGKVGNYENGKYVGSGKDPLSEGAFKDDIEKPEEVKKDLTEAERLEAERLANAGKKDELTGLLSMDEIFDPYRMSIEEAKAEDKRLKEAYGIDTGFYEDGRKNNINMSLIQAGLAIAGGTSANPLENISKGALPALEAFNKEQSRLSGANRLENMQSLQNYRDNQDKLRAYAIDLYGKNALRDAEAAKLNVGYMEKAKKEAQDKMNALYGTGMAGTFFNTPLGRIKYEELRNKYAVKALKEYTTNEISDEIIEVFVPYIDASGNVAQINLANKEDLGNLSQEQIKSLNEYKN